MIERVNNALRAKDFAAAVSHYVDYFKHQPALVKSLCGLFNFCRTKVMVNRQFSSPTIAVCCWNTANNALGRAVTLAQGYRAAGYNCNVIGCAPFPQWHKVWQPLAESEFSPSYFELPDHDKLLELALDFVLANPFDIVHLSKPRLPNIVIGLLYKQIWGAKVLIDIDDEELGFVAYDPTQLNSELSELLEKLHPIKVDSAIATILSIKLKNLFDGTTVSNPALQQRYGGLVVPHIRNELEFIPSTSRCLAARKRFGIPNDKKIVLFAGTPRVHKGILETAKALAALNRDDYLYVVVGDFVDKALLNQLLAIEGLHLKLLPNQPYSEAADTVAMGDIAVILQDDAKEAAAYQLPAKLIDAIAMGLTVLLEPVPSTLHIADSGIVETTSKISLQDDLAFALDEQSIAMPSIERHEFFKQNLSLAAFTNIFTDLGSPKTQVSPTELAAGLLNALVRNEFKIWLNFSAKN